MIQPSPLDNHRFSHVGPEALRRGSEIASYLGLPIAKELNDLFVTQGYPTYYGPTTTALGDFIGGVILKLLTKPQPDGPVIDVKVEKVKPGSKKSKAAGTQDFAETVIQLTPL